MTWFNYSIKLSKIYYIHNFTLVEINACDEGDSPWIDSSMKHLIHGKNETEVL